MTDYQFFYRKDTFQIDAVYRDSKTESMVFKDPATYVEVNVTDPLYVVDRDHKVVLGAEGQVIGTEPSVNPVQPTPAPNPRADLLTALASYGVHSFTPAQVDAFINGVSTVAELRALLKTMAKCIIAYAEYFESVG